jgi:hypothetical protein
MKSTPMYPAMRAPYLMLRGDLFVLRARLRDASGSVAAIALSL